MQLRSALESDLPRILALAAAKRAEYTTYSPVFWRVAPDATEKQAAFFLDQRLHNPQALTLVAERDGLIEGFIMALIHSAPPAYDPGGPVCSIDDYTVATPDLWTTTGAALLDAATTWAREHGAVLMIIVAGQRDQPKRAMLEATNATIASEWWIKPLH